MGGILTILILLLGCQLICSSVQRTKENSVITMINTKWNLSPFVLEVVEFFAEENNHLFWTYVDIINSLDPSLSELGTEKDKYEVCMKEAAKLLSPVYMNLLKLSLSLHLYSPRVEMYSQMASERNVLCNPSVDIAGLSVCSIAELDAVLSDLPVNPLTETYINDHHYHINSNSSVLAILYGEVGTRNFATFHNVLKRYADDGKIDYVLRHHVQNRLNKRVRLSGYGVELQMKSTEYKAEDDAVVDSKAQNQDIQNEFDESVVRGFDFKILKERFPDKHIELEKFRAHLLESSDDLIPLKVWQFQDLALQAAHLIANSPVDTALDLFVDIAQNFPMRSRSLVSISVSPDLKKEIQRNQDQFIMSLNIQSNEAALFINGLYFEVEHTDMMTILEHVRREIRMMEGVYKLGLTDRSVIRSLLSLDLADPSNQQFAIDIRDSAVLWINNLEQDAKYKRWPNHLTELLKPTFPGMMRSIRRNFFNLVIICDPSDRKCWPLIKLTESFVVYSASLRVGFIFSVPPTPVSGLESGAVALFNAFNYISENYDRSQALSFITDVYASIKTDRDVQVNDVKKRLKAKYYNIDLDDVLGSDSDYNTGRQLATEFLSRSGLNSLPQVLVNGIPLQEKSLTREDFEEAMLTEIMTQTPIYQKAIYKGELVDSDDVVDFIMSRPNVMPRLNNRVLSKESNQYLDFTGLTEAALLPDMRYISNAKAGRVHMITNWIVGDFETTTARKLLRNVIDYLETGMDNRFSILINAEDSNGKRNSINNLLIASLLKDFDISTILKDEAQILNEEKSFEDYGLTTDMLPEVENLIRKQKTYLKEVLSFKPGDCGIISNGRILGPFAPNEEFLTADFLLLEKYALNSYAEKVYRAIKSNLAEIPYESQSDIFMKVSSLFNSRQQTKARIQFPELSENYSVVKLPAKNTNEPVFELYAVVDPVSRGAQKLAPILATLYQVLNAEIKIYLNPVDRNSDMPLKSYYRFVLEPEIRFHDDGSLSNGPIADFFGVSGSSLLTLYMHVPENWLVESVVTPYDLDNIRLKDVGGTVYSQFELEYLLLEGHCFDTMYGNPPRGLQITLGTETNPVIMDTIVMANLGYFQLKANPGAWILRLREGRSSDIYEVVGHEGADTTANSSDIKVLVGSFQSQILKLRVSKKPGKFNEQLLDDDEPSSNSIWNSITSTFSGSSGPDSSEEEPINIFSVASGHLYERFLRIMMLSVMKHTKSPVKFWFLKNYLSPSFKDFLPKMAEKYNFQYELVQYKWPRWLHQQNEKQRIIWGYKILFLDVLFPLHVKKIIFVDADQVVRADLKELVDLDLQGAPYGYTPFCSSRKEMDGFRFWRQGYWRTHLQGRSYHISALYVVDLKRFRKIAAGDRLRGQYQALSQDPNSLSNLDQDLPNNMIHQVAIKSLPQEWLWCETWCDNESKKKAKTIDLCNNPLTKEAKLSAAMRIVDEWKDYDEEIKRLQFGLDEVQDEEVLEETTPRSIEDIHNEL